MVDIREKEAIKSSHSSAEKDPSLSVVRVIESESERERERGRERDERERERGKSGRRNKSTEIIGKEMREYVSEEM